MAQAQLPDKIGEPEVVNSYFPGQQSNPVISSLTNGNYVITWQSHEQTNNTASIFAQMYHQYGQPLGSEFMVSSPAHIHPQVIPAISRLNDGGFVIIWLSKDANASTYSMHGQLFKADGIKSGSELLLKGKIVEDVDFPKVSHLGDGGFVVTWRRHSSLSGEVSAIVAQRYTVSGEPNGTLIEVDTSKTGDALSPVVTTLVNGQFVIAWDGPVIDINYDIFAQRFNPDGTKVGSETALHDRDSFFQVSASISALKDGGYLVTWLPGKEKTHKPIFKIFLPGVMHLMVLHPAMCLRSIHSQLMVIPIQM
ncbi:MULTISPECIES: hypothetical protein [unclassified Pseudoalteromonas]|uniref:hypothetical protein n=1 Tax=unclassified Pseudoalteromonas TaxID=194690 RepID=UPI002097B331|nr:hypothetical protein [Pseudoalteromonas sp. XMcav2-N]MCO7189774.1 hypothetical protein [Pseudoalteromonas sp. XMcav2-N]